MNTREFMEKIAADAKENNFAITEKLQTAESNEAVYAIAQEEGLTDSYEAFMGELKKIHGDELSEEELEAVSGGFVLVFAAVGAIATGVKKIMDNQE